MGVIIKYGLPLLAVSGFSFAAYRVVQTSRPTEAAPPIVQPPRSPFPLTISGAGIVEARTQNIAIATQIPGVIAEVFVGVGDRVTKDAPLFRIDDRDRRAELAVRELAVESARAELARLEALPRPEDLPPLEARVRTAQSELADGERQLALLEGVQDKRAVSIQELDKRRSSVLTARARVLEAEAALTRARQGVWAPELELARRAIASAEARVAAQRTEVERCTVRAAVGGTVLAVNARTGEYAQTGPAALILLGDTERLHVRVDIDENDAWRFQPGSKARGVVRGNRELGTDLEFVRVDPFVIPKRSLTGESTERVDTRVLQVLFAFDPAHLPVYVGQQLDVFIEVRP
jgi:multidrug efflux pump subunit AcrA (membrane-fusion protein)